MIKTHPITSASLPDRAQKCDEKSTQMSRKCDENQAIINSMAPYINRGFSYCGLDYSHSIKYHINAN